MFKFCRHFRLSKNYLDWPALQWKHSEIGTVDGLVKNSFPVYKTFQIMVRKYKMWMKGAVWWRCCCLPMAVADDIRRSLSCYSTPHRNLNWMLCFSYIVLTACNITEDNCEASKWRKKCWERSFPCSYPSEMIGKPSKLGLHYHPTPSPRRISQLFL